MKIILNGTATDVTATTLADIVAELGHGDAKIATAVNEVFVAKAQRANHPLAEGDRLEILAPMQGG